MYWNPQGLGWEDPFPPPRTEPSPTTPSTLSPGAPQQLGQGCLCLRLPGGSGEPRPIQNSSPGGANSLLLPG